MSGPSAAPLRRAASRAAVTTTRTMYGKKRGSFSLFMGARRQFEEMPNKKVKSGEHIY